MRTHAQTQFCHVVCFLRFLVEMPVMDDDFFIFYIHWRKGIKVFLKKIPTKLKFVGPWCGDSKIMIYTGVICKRGNEVASNTPYSNHFD